MRRALDSGSAAFACSERGSQLFTPVLEDTHVAAVLLCLN